MNNKEKVIDSYSVDNFVMQLREETFSDGSHAYCIRMCVRRMPLKLEYSDLKQANEAFSQMVHAVDCTTYIGE